MQKDVWPKNDLVRATNSSTALSMNSGTGLLFSDNRREDPGFYQREKCEKDNEPTRVASEVSPRGSEG